MRGYLNAIVLSNVICTAKICREMLYGIFATDRLTVYSEVDYRRFHFTNIPFIYFISLFSKDQSIPIVVIRTLVRFEQAYEIVGFQVE